MMMIWAMALMAQAVGSSASAAPVDPVLAPAAALYDELCLRAFPDDRAVDALMAARGATSLTPEQVKITLGADPGRGWQLPIAGRTALIFLESPPYHACSIRWPAPAADADFGPYRAAIDPYIATHSGFTAMAPFENDVGDIHVSATGVQRPTPGGGESLFVIEQRVLDPARRAKGETGIMRRFVHQMKAPRAS